VQKSRSLKSLAVPSLRMPRLALGLLLWGLGSLAVAADPQIASLVDSPDPVPAGGLVAYTVRVDNEAATAASNVALSFRITAGDASFVSASPPSANCTQTNPTQIDCAIGALAGNGVDVRDVVFTWRANGPGPATVNALASITADSDENFANNLQAEVTTVVTGANLALTKVGNPNPVVGGAQITYTLTASNAGPNDGGAMVVTDSLPPSVAFVSATGTDWTCGHAAGTVTCNRPGTLAVGAISAPITIVGTVNASGGTVTNSATVAPASGGVADPDTSDNSTTVDTTVTPGADVRIAQKVVLSATPIVAGADVSFRIDPRNGGPAVATSVTVTDPLPAGWTYLSADGPGWACGATANVVSCTRASMAVGATDDITVVARAPDTATVGSGASYVNTASIAATSDDPDAGNNSASVTVNVLPDGADLALTKTKSPNPVALGGQLTSRIVVNNNGPRVATGPLRVVELLVGETFVSASGSGWVCTPAGNVVTCDHPNASGLAVGASLPMLTILSTADDPGVLSNTACTGGSVPAGSGGTALPPVEGDSIAGNDCATASSRATTVQPDLAIAKTTSTPTGGDKIVSASESSVTYTLVVGNVSVLAQDATGVRIADTVPGFINGSSSIVTPVVATPSGGSTATFNCTVSNATVTCLQSGGVLASGETVTVPITVQRPLQDGSFTNTARVANSAEGDPNASNNVASDTVTIEPVADVEMTGKSVTPAAVRAGEQATYVLSYRNNGPSTAQNVALTDTLSFAPGDSGFTVVSVASSKPGSSCSIAAGAVLDTASPSFSCSIGSLANGETQSVTLVVRPNFLAGNAVRTVNNTAAVTTSSTENPAGGNNGNNSRSALLTVNPAQVDLLVNKTDIVDPLAYIPGNTFIGYRVRVTSNGPSFATNVRVIERMTPPAGKRVRFVCDTTTFGGSTCNPVPLCSVADVTSAAGTAIPDFTCSVPAGSASTGLAVGELTSGSSKDIFLRAEVLDSPAPTGDIFVNTATTVANEPDNFAANDSVDEQTTVRQRVDLRVSKTASVASPTLNQPFDWVVTVVNNGPGNSLQTDLTDTLPAGASVTGPVTWTRTLLPGSGSCTVSGQVVSCSLGQLDGTGVATVTIPVRFTSYPAGGTATNSATVDTDPDKTGGIDTPGGNNTGISPVTVTRSSIAGTVFEDRDRSGSNGGVPQAAVSEPRIASVSLTLTGTDAYGNAISRSAVTDSNGNYSLDNLPPGSYTVTQAQPAGFVNGPVAPPSAGADAPSDGGSYSAGGNSTWAVTLGGNNAAVRYNFPEVRQPSLSGTVYIDANLNGSRDAGSDPLINGATVRLLNASNGAVVATTTTDANGAYSFTGLDPLIVYTLEQPLPTAPAGLGNGPINPGLIGGAACASGCTAQPDTPALTTDRIASIDLGSGQDGTAFDFGERQLTRISGTVFIDRDRDDTLDPLPTDGRLPGVTLRLVQGADCSSGTTLQTTTTDANGTYAFDNVAAGGSYLICETQPPGYADGTGNVISITNLAPGGSDDNNFGERVGALAGAVYADFSPATPAATDNGQRDAGEAGIAGVTVTLTGRDINGNAVNRSTTTDANGDWRFDDLLQSDASGYTVTEGSIPPAAGSFNDGRDTAGSAGGTAGNDTIGAIVLGAGVQGSGYLFGELPIAPISGTIFIDRDRDGVFDPAPADAPLPGVTLTLYPGPSCSGTPLATTTTDASGSYLFSGLSAGLTYTVCETQPPGYANGSPNQITLSNLPATGAAGNDFAEQVGSLAGAVYLDADNDGTRDTGEPGLAGVTVTLTGTDAAGNPVNRSTTSAADGSWRFDDLLAGNYAVTEQAAQPVVSGTTTLDGRSTAGSSGGTATAVGSNPSAVSGISLAAGDNAIGYLFGEILPVAVSGTVFLDIDNSGTQNGTGDTGLAGVSIVITGTDDTGSPVTRSVTTDANGRYSVPDLRPGTYTLTEPTQPAGTSNGQTVPGSGGGTATPVATLPSAISGIVLTTPGASATDNNFAEQANNSAVAGRVWLDADDDGVIDADENGIAGVAIVLTGTNTAGQPVNASTVTDASGQWRFDNLAPGTYTVTEPTQPAGTVNGRTVPGTAGGAATAPAVAPSVIDGIVLGVGVSAIANHFGELPSAVISGRVYLDNNDDGNDAGETGLSGVTLVLTGTDDLGNPVSRTVVTDTNGNWQFDGLRPGTYTVTQPDQPGGTVNGRTTPGTAGGVAGGTGGAPSVISGIVLTPGASAADNLFGEIGQSPDLRVLKQLDETVLTVTQTGTYRLSVRNVGEVDSSGLYTVSDRLPGGLTLAATPTGTGWACTGAVGAGSFACTSSSVVPTGGSNASVIVAVVNVAATAAAASPAVNVTLVEGGGEVAARGPSPAERDAFNGNAAALPACGTVAAFNACSVSAPVQLAASISGSVWFDVGSASRLLDSGDRLLPGWQVEVLDASGAIVGQAVTDQDGRYRVADLLPGVPLTVRFRDPDSGVVFGYPVNGETAPGSSGVGCVTGGTTTGGQSSCVGEGASPALAVVLAAGQELPQQSLPVDPSGVVYDSGSRAPVAGSVVTLAPAGVCTGWDPASGIVGAALGGYTIAGDAIAMTVGADGFYQYLIAPDAPASCTFALTVTPPAGYSFASTAIPPAADPLQPPGNAGSVFAVQPQAGAPTAAPGSGTTYYLQLVTGSGGANVVHNHIPLDPALPAGVSISKTGDRALAEVGDTVRYTIAVQTTGGALPRQTTVVDRLPAGFTYVPGTASVNEVPIADPAGGVGPTLAFQLGPMTGSGPLVLRYRARVGVGAQQGDGINRAQAFACGVPAGCVGPDFQPLPGSLATNEARYRVRVSGGVFTTEACVLGKIFVDCNGNHVQDPEELGIPGVRLLMEDGTTLVSDSEGKYSVCGVSPRSHVLKVDPITLPQGSRLMTTSNRNLGDAGSLWLDVKNGELHRADFIEGSCRNPVLDQVKARRAQGEVRAPERERERGPALRFDSKAHGLTPQTTPQQGTDGANQMVPKPRSGDSHAR